MRQKLRVGFASVMDATAETTWSGTPLNTLTRLRAFEGIEVVPVTPLKTTIKYLYLPYKLLEKITGKYFIWYLQPLALRYLANQVASAFRRHKLDVIFATSSIPVSRLPSEVPYVFWTDAVFQAAVGYGPGVFSNLSEKTRKAGEAQEQAAIRGARFACYASNWAAQSASQLATGDNVRVLPYGPNMTIKHDRDAIPRFCRERRTARKDGCTLLLVGKDWERKGGPAAMEAARLLNEAGIKTTLRLIGCRPPGVVPPYVELLGSLSKAVPEELAKMEDAYRDADLFIMPSQAEAFGIVATEAAAWGLPALVCRTGGLSDCVIDGQTGFGLAVSDTGAGFAEAAQRILKDYERFALGAYDLYRTQLNWELSVERLVGLLQTAAGR